MTTELQGKRWQRLSVCYTRGGAQCTLMDNVLSIEREQLFVPVNARDTLVPCASSVTACPCILERWLYRLSFGRSHRKGGKYSFFVAACIGRIVAYSGTLKNVHPA